MKMLAFKVKKYFKHWNTLVHYRDNKISLFLLRFSKTLSLIIF